MPRTLLATVVAILLAVPLSAQNRTATPAAPDPRIPAGATTVTLDAAAIRASGARTLPELLAGRIAGLSVTWASGIAGIAPRIHVRGSTGVIGQPEPLLIIDGVRMRADLQLLGTLLNEPSGELLPAFMWEIPVDQIERVDVVLGAAGGAYLEYGAARGVVFVTTRRTAAGAPHVEASLEALMPTTPTLPPDNYGTRSVEFPDVPTYCTLPRQATGICTPTSREQWNPLGQSRLLTPRSGMRASLLGSGGFAGGAWKTSASAERGASLLEQDGLDRFEFGGAYTRAIGARTSVVTDVRYRRAIGYYGPLTELLSRSIFGRTKDDSIGGFSMNPDSIEPLALAHRVDQLVIGTQLQMTATEHVRAAARVGFDRGQRFSQRLTPATGPVGAIRESLAARDAGASLSADLAYDHTLRRGIGGSALLTATLARHWPAERREEITYYSNPLETLGTSTGSIQLLTIAMGERITLGAGRSIGIGARFERGGKGEFASESGLLPSLDVSWSIRDDSLASEQRMMHGLRLRAAHGVSVDGGAVVRRWAQVRPPEPQRITETELGLSAGIFRSAATLDLTVFHRRATNSFYFGALPSSPPTTVATYQGARWDVSGIDVGLSVSPIAVGPLEWRSLLTVSFLEYGDFNGSQARPFLIADGFRPIYSQRRGDPFGTILTEPYTFDDANGDGIIVPSEVTVQSTELEARGNSQPRRILGLNTSFTLGDRVAFGAQLDAKGGHVAYNFTEAFRCQSGLCRALHDPSASLSEQARAVQVGYSGFIEEASFVKLREVWVRIGLNRRVGTEGAGTTELVLSARNLATWTGFSGLDPEVGGLFGPGLRIGEDRSYPLARSFSVGFRIAR